MLTAHQAWKTEIESRGNVAFRLGHEVAAVVTRKSKSPNGPVEIEYKVSDVLDQASSTANFDHIILAIDANSALKLLGKGASWMEKRILGNVKYLYDVTITHNDLEYMQKVRTCCSQIFRQ